MALRAQAELIATVILVSIALTLALGLVYFLSPYLASARASQQVVSTLADISAGLSIGSIAYESWSGGKAVVVVVYYNGPTSPVTLYYAVLPVWNSTPVEELNYTYNVYEMESPGAVLAVADPESYGWAPLPSFNASAESIHVLVRSSYQPLEVLVHGAGSITLYSSLVEPGSMRIYMVRVEYTGAVSVQLRFSVFAAVGTDFYEVGGTLLP